VGPRAGLDAVAKRKDTSQHLPGTLIWFLSYDTLSSSELTRCFSYNKQFAWHILNYINCRLNFRDVIKRRLNSGNACYYHSVQNLLSSRLISKN
jgi:hypothetical protein